MGIDNPLGKVERFFAEIRGLHVRAEEPSSRAIARAIGGTSHSTVNDLLRGRRIPSWPIVSKVVEYLAGDEEFFRDLWVDTRQSDPVSPAPPELTWRELDVDSDSDLNGVFWIAGADPDTALPGRLRFTEGRTRLQLFGQLTDWLETVRTDQTADGSIVVERRPRREGPEHEQITIHGSLNRSPQAITLVNCFTVGRREAGAVSEQLLDALYALRGARLNERDQVYSAVRIRFVGIDDWIRLPSFTLGIAKDLKSSASIEYRTPPEDAVSLGSGPETIRTHSQIDTPVVSSSGDATISRRIWLSIEELTDKPYREIDRDYISPILTLATLATRRERRLTQMLLRASDGSWVTYLSGATSAVGAETARIEHPLVYFSDVGVGGLARWITRAATLGPIPPIVANFRSDPRWTIESKLLELTTAAEGLHLRLFPDARRMTPLAAEELRSAVKATLHDFPPDQRQSVAGLLSHLEDPSYAQCLRGLAANLKGTDTRSYGKLNKWVEAISGARNAFAHRLEVDVVNDKLDEFVTLSTSIEWFLTLILLREAGVDDQVLADRLANRSDYRIFLSRARSDLPRVFNAIVA